MKGLWAALLVSGCAVVPVRATFTPSALAPEQLEGRWYVVVSNFPRWARQDLSDPTFNCAWCGGGVLGDVVAARTPDGHDALIRAAYSLEP